MAIVVHWNDTNYHLDVLQSVSQCAKLHSAADLAVAVKKECLFGVPYELSYPFAIYDHNAWLPSIRGNRLLSC